MTQINEINNTRRKSAGKPISLFTRGSIQEGAGGGGRGQEGAGGGGRGREGAGGGHLNSRPSDCKFNARVQAFGATISGIVRMSKSA